MIAELVFVGTELLLGEILNTNAQYLSERLALLGIDVYHQATVGDNPDRMAQVFATALARADLVIASGGLGPTMDDLTREVAAQVTGCPLALDQGIRAGLESFFRQRSRAMPANNSRQAMVPRGATILHNDRGTAPGLIIHTADGKAVVLLPGPPIELRPMFERAVVPFLTSRMGGQPMSLVTRTLRFVDIGESALEEALRDIMAGQSDPSVAPYAKTMEVHLRIATKAADQEAGLAKIEPVEQEIRSRVAAHLYGVDGVSLEEAVGLLLAERGLTLSTAESCTGGLVARRITEVPGSSAYFGAGFITYSNQAKIELLGVAAELLEQHGAVSEPVVAAMAEGALRRSGAKIAVAVSGIAGPSGGTAAKPVGTVCLALAAGGSKALPAGVWTRTFQFWGSRADVRDRSGTAALAMVRRYLLGQRV